MRTILKLAWTGRAGLIGALLATFAGWLAHSIVVVDPLTLLSYDLPVSLKPSLRSDEIVIIYLDDEAVKTLEQEPKSFDRSLHVDVLKRLTSDRARLVVYDIWFGDARPEADAAFERAIRDHGNVVLCAVVPKSAHNGLIGGTVARPLPALEAAAAGVGLAELRGQGSVVRQFDPGFEDTPALPWAAARAAQLSIALLPPPDLTNFWINYHGRSFGYVRFSDVLAQETGFFSNRYVFVGTYPLTPYAFDEKDEFKVPHSRMSGMFSPGVDIWATAFLNLKRRDWLTRWPGWAELLLLTGAGIFFGAGFAGRSWRMTLKLALAGALVLALTGFGAAWIWNSWFCWTLSAGIQIPVALAWAAHRRLRMEQWAPQKTSATVTETTALLGSRDSPAGGASKSPGVAAPALLVLADHTLLRQVGRGAYGEVWLARNAVGLHHALKIVRQQEFNAREPFEREFRGIEKFMPISRSHPGLVHVLHVGRNDAEGYYYYVMEVADDCERGVQIDPPSYVPRSLANDLRSKGSLSARGSLELLIALSAAVQHLHEQQLLHRDIKPSNIIYVQGRPKLADIGLVRDMPGPGERVSFLGTPGYIPPEGPGTPAADVYSLGKVLYQACTGMDSELFPELPTDVRERSDSAALMELNRIIGRACYPDTRRRYVSAAEFQADLLKLLHRIPEPG